MKIFSLAVQWNPVNMDTKGTRQSVRIIQVSVLSGLSEKHPGHMFFQYKDMFTVTKRSVTATSAK